MPRSHGIAHVILSFHDMPIESVIIYLGRSGPSAHKKQVPQDAQNYPKVVDSCQLETFFLHLLTCLLFVGPGQ